LTFVDLATPLVVMYGPQLLLTTSLTSSSFTPRSYLANSMAASSRLRSFILAILFRTILRQYDLKRDKKREDQIGELRIIPCDVMHVYTGSARVDTSKLASCKLHLPILVGLDDGDVVVLVVHDDGLLALLVVVGAFGTLHAGLVKVHDAFFDAGINDDNPPSQ